MPTDSPSQGQGHGRRQFHRGRRPEQRRGHERRGPQSTQQPERADSTDVEQIMREIRTRISQQPGIELTAQQIQELAARRLESILDPRTIRPALLEQLRKSAGTSTRADAKAAPEAPYSFEDTTLYESHRGAMRFMRRLLNPILKLFFNPNPLIRALNIQARVNTELLARDAERERRQAEWNALHFEILQRVVTEVSRVSLEIQNLTLRVESLSTKVDFNDRRVRTIEAGVPAARPAREHTREHAREATRELPRELPPSPAPAPGQASTPAAPEAPSGDAAPPGVEGTRRRRRRRRGRRGAGSSADSTTAPTDAALAAGDDAETVDSADSGEGDGDEGPDDDVAPVTTEGETVVEALRPVPPPSEPAEAAKEQVPEPAHAPETPFEPSESAHEPRREPPPEG